MKIEVNIPDDTIRAAVEQQVSKYLATLTGEAIEKQVAAMLDKKVDRVDLVPQARAVLKEKLDASLMNALGVVHAHQVTGALRALMSEAVLKLVRDFK